MDEYAVDILPGEILRWARDDQACEKLQFWVRAERSYEVERDLETGRPRIGDEDDVSLVIAKGILEISPRRGRRGWVIQVRSSQEEGMRSSGEDEGYEDDDNLSVDAFAEQFLVPGHGEVEIVVQAEDDAAWEAFQRWLVRQRQGA